MGPCLFGLETEYAFAAVRGEGKASQRAQLVERFMALARDRLPHLSSGAGSGMFLSNGARFYLDSGGHPEYCTPECTDPWQLVRYAKAGDETVAGLAREMESTIPGVTVRFSRGNVDYSGTHATWGCHESYLVPAAASWSGRRGIIEQLTPHLVSRIVYTGGGGFNPRSDGLEFTLSPRAWHLDHAVSNSSTGDRGIFHTKDESLANRRYRRVHLLCGDGLRSETALWLGVGTTALVLALIAAGKDPGDGVQPAQPVAALRAFAQDPGCAVRVPMSDGPEASAIVIQRHYLQQVEQCLGASFLPDWAEDVCRRWREVLDALAADPASLARVLDWPLKRTLYDDHLQRRGMDWERLGTWTAVANGVCGLAARVVAESAGEGKARALPRKLLLYQQFRRLAPSADGQRMAWRDLKEFFALRHELFEIDTRYGEVGADGLFSTLDRAGVLRQRVVEQDEIDRSTTSPPEGSRASIRGAVIARLAADGGPATCSWDRVLDGRSQRVLDLSDPFTNEETWRSAEEMAPDFGDPSLDVLALLHRHGL